MGPQAWPCGYLLSQEASQLVAMPMPRTHAAMLHWMPWNRQACSGQPCWLLHAPKVRHFTFSDLGTNATVGIGLLADQACVRR